MPMVLCPLFIMFGKHTGKELKLGGRHRRAQQRIIQAHGGF